jgi:hypothetical protein
MSHVNKPLLKIQLIFLTTSMISLDDNALAYAAQGYPKNVACQLSLEASSSSDIASIEQVARTCNDFRVQNEFEFNLVKGACVLGGSLSGLLYSFSEVQCKSENAAALCRVPIPSTGTEELTWYFEPESSQEQSTSHDEKFQASCDNLGGIFTKLKF